MGMTPFEIGVKEINNLKGLSPSAGPMLKEKGKGPNKALNLSHNLKGEKRNTGEVILDGPLVKSTTKYIGKSYTQLDNDGHGCDEAAGSVSGDSRIAKQAPPVM